MNEDPDSTYQGRDEEKGIKQHYTRQSCATKQEFYLVSSGTYVAPRINGVRTRTMACNIAIMSQVPHHFICT